MKKKKNCSLLILINSLKRQKYIYIYKTEIFIKFPRNIHGC